jgi:hypothetical protein
METLAAAALVSYFGNSIFKLLSSQHGTVLVNGKEVPWMVIGEWKFNGILPVYRWSFYAQVKKSVREWCNVSGWVDVTRKVWDKIATKKSAEGAVKHGVHKLLKGPFTDDNRALRALNCLIQDSQRIIPNPMSDNLSFLKENLQVDTIMNSKLSKSVLLLSGIGLVAYGAYLIGNRFLQKGKDKTKKE